MKALKTVLVLAVFAAALFAGRLFYLADQSRSTSPELGLAGGKLTYCPQKPNCVSSQEEGDHFIEPIKSDISIEKAKKRLLRLPGARLEDEGQDYIHLTFRSELFGFLDDVELVKTDGLYHIRSASRVGYSDMGANRERAERIREILTKDTP